ncbi:neuritin isoform X2 [Rhinopithecus roxellana]|uniref:neuritin isoform X2 n=1 Tax=Rhinopithecus roxellana TaxID=61622 RepID=UPI001237916C|nr:neuritin isoform X2 [Rhinopithecus roxellana]
MGLKLNGRYISLILAVQIAYLVQAVRAAGKCDAVFKGFSDCLLKLGDSMANYPQGLDDKTNIKTVCTFPRGGRAICLRRPRCQRAAAGSRPGSRLPSPLLASGRENQAGGGVPPPPL